MGALQIQLSGMMFVTERNRLFRSGRLRRRLRRHSKNRDCGDAAELKNPAPQFHSSPLRICSAKYSEARMESAQIVIVGFCEPPVTKLLPSTTKRFLMSWL